MSKYILMVLFAFVLVTINDAVTPYDDSDNVDTKSRSGMEIKRDNLTGCEYLKTYWSAPTPRLGADGKQVCRPATPR